MGVPFVGRRDELAVLGGLIARARRESGPTVALVTGEPGTGKSRLLREVISGLDTRRTVLLNGFEPIEPIPLAAASELLRRLSSVPDHGPRLFELAFGRGHRAAEGALQVFEAANRALASFGPIVVAVDDLQWVDAQSVALLHFLVSAAESARRPIAVIAAARPSATTLAFADGVVRARPENRGTSVELRGLDRDAGIALVRSLDEDLDAAAVAAIWDRSVGNPFWLEALARSGGAGDASAFIADRFRALSRDAGSLLNVLAIGARPLAREELAAFIDWPAGRVEHASKELVARGLAVDEGENVRLAHDLIREAATGSMSAAASRSMHIRVAEVLEGVAGRDLPLLAEALDHRLVAGQPSADLALKLIASPQRRLLGSAGLRRLSSIAGELAPASAERLELDAGIARVAAVVGDQDLALHHWLVLADGDVGAEARQRALCEGALAAYRMGRGPEAHALLDRARGAAPLTQEALAVIQALRAEIALWLDHDVRGGAAAARVALAASRAAVDASGGLHHLTTETRRAHVAALEASIGAAMQEERFDDISTFTSEILPAARGLDPEAYVAALLRSGFALRPAGALEEAERAYREAWTIAHQLVLPYPMIDAGIGLARALRDLGRLEEAHAIASETVALEARLGSPPGRWGNAVATLHAVQLSRGDAAGAEGVRRDARDHTNPHYRLAIHQLLALWLSRTEPARARAEIEGELAAGANDARAAGCPRCEGELQVAGAEILARIGRVDDARGRLAAWEARPIGDYPARVLWRLSASAQIAIADGDVGRAAELLDRLVSACTAVGDVDELIWAQMDRGRLYSRLDRARAIEAFAAAARLADAAGAVSRARIAARALRRLGVRTWRRGAIGARGEGGIRLSAREHEVANLVAGGQTNAEVSASLAISLKTVERHLTNILAKVGARNRTELAARLAGRVRGSPDE